MEIVKLNMGGYNYITTKSTLTSIGENFFTTMLQGQVPTIKDEQGAFFVDCDGEHFKPILTYLRTGEFEVTDNLSERKVRKLAQFLMIPLPPAFPLDVVTDESLVEKFYWSKFVHCEGSSELIQFITEQFCQCAEQSKPVQTVPICPENDEPFITNLTTRLRKKIPSASVEKMGFLVYHCEDDPRAAEAVSDYHRAKIAMSSKAMHKNNKFYNFLLDHGTELLHILKQKGLNVRIHNVREIREIRIPFAFQILWQPQNWDRVPEEMRRASI